MKLTCIALTTVLGVCLTGNLRAEGPGMEGLHPGKRGQHEKVLTKEEREKLKEAHKAVRDNPEVVAAREQMKAAAENLRQTMRNALLAKDPSLEPILDKIGDRPRKPGMGGPDGRGPGVHGDDPEVQSALEKRRNATTPEERKAAMDELREAMRNARAEDNG